MTEQVEKKYSLQLLFSYFLLFCLFCSCSKKVQQTEGEKLVRMHCASCHLFPEPTVLSKNMWLENVLPNMGHKMGMTHHGPVYYDAQGTVSKTDNPEMLSQAEWEKIVLYYSHFSLPSYIPKPETILESTQVFEAFAFSNDSINNNFITLVHYDSLNQNLLLGDAENSSLHTLTALGKLKETKKLSAAPVKIVVKDSIQYLLIIGELNPSDASKGKLYVGTKLIDSLIRPVDFLVQDVDLDGFEDIFVCNYGNTIGDFSLYHNLKNGTYKKEVLFSGSGAIKVVSVNLDADKANEIVVLFAQEKESLLIWDVENGVFTAEKVLQFQPAFGSVDYQFRDIDADGDQDLILCNGDNADLSMSLKKEHGVRIFLNNGHKKFEESYFYAMHGVSKVAVEDFDLDGDLDIMLISNFGNFADPNFKSVQLLENKGGLNFQAQQIKKLPNLRWQTMDVADADSDGDLDVFLGVFGMNIGPKESIVKNEGNISWVKLENKTN
ncbi:FG-GAP repeat domain-containing protein [Flavicella sediminum]|uniref:FG-GAP repeat domain-containing protein n=1 Tax=Flavicella sediminum TaxID=2585141 RepID=UPI0011232FAB|nr:VCBS repeat-containing protein [Flavicella sediminum]